jgi:hypothetical protein
MAARKKRKTPAPQPTTEEEVPQPPPTPAAVIKAQRNKDLTSVGDRIKYAPKWESPIIATVISKAAKSCRVRNTDGTEASVLYTKIIGWVCE